jgi:hypothetical protein
MGGIMIELINSWVQSNCVLITRYIDSALIMLGLIFVPALLYWIYDSFRDGGARTLH